MRDRLSDFDKITKGLFDEYPDDMVKRYKNHMEIVIKPRDPSGRGPMAFLEVTMSFYEDGLTCLTSTYTTPDGGLDVNTVPLTPHAFNTLSNLIQIIDKSVYHG